MHTTIVTIPAMISSFMLVSFLVFYALYLVYVYLNIISFVALIALNDNLTTKLVSNFGSTIAVDGGTFSFLTAYSVGNIIFIFGTYKITKSVGNHIGIFQVSSQYYPKLAVQAVCTRSNDATSRQLYIDVNGVIRLYTMGDTTGTYNFNATYNI